MYITCISVYGYSKDKCMLITFSFVVLVANFVFDLQPWQVNYHTKNLIFIHHLYLFLNYL